MALYKRPNSKFYWMKFVFDGQTVQRSTKCSNKQDALTVEGAYRTQLALGKVGINPPPKAPDLTEACADFLKWSKVEHADHPGTHKKYYFSCESLKTFFGKKKTDKIKITDIENFIVWRSGQTSRKTKTFVTRQTVNFDLYVLKMIFKRLTEADILRENPARKAKQLTETETAFHVLTFDEEKRYLLACPQPLQDVAIIMLESGMRCGEVYQLRRLDLHLSKSFLKVRKGKTKSAIRNVHLSGKAKDVLAGRLHKFKGDFLFPQNDVDGLEETKTLDRFHLLTIRRLGYAFRLYDCRHTFATRAVESGVDLLTLASMLGHANLKMVSRYAHPSESHKADAIEKMQRARNGETTSAANKKLNQVKAG